jgi:hypothetical protein
MTFGQWIIHRRARGERRDAQGKAPNLSFSHSHFALRTIVQPHTGDRRLATGDQTHRPHPPRPFIHFPSFHRIPTVESKPQQTLHRILLYAQTFSPTPATGDLRPATKPRRPDPHRPFIQVPSFHRIPAFESKPHPNPSLSPKKLPRLFSKQEISEGYQQGCMNKG